ncbi:FAD-binding protein [Streptomyces torulosus]|uniref:FAD-binding protein n=1 Tax=Streptomyces torulosus TaxID=68276 RepID=UPI0006EB82C3|nr:FAD-binding protein [Streptomyces torulosus]
MGIIDELKGSWDLVVVGHGFAGLSAARAALEDAAAEGRSLRVAVLERAAEGDRGGSTAWTHAYLRLTGDGELDPSWQRNVRENAGARANEDYIEAFGSNVPTTLRWLHEAGVQTPSSPSPFSPSGYSWNIEGGGRAVIEAYVPRITAAGGSFFYETTARELVVAEDGSIAGLVVTAANGATVTMESRAVVLACGGFEGNPEMLTRYLPHAHQLTTVSPGTDNNRGDGIRMAVEVGADTAGQFDGAHIEPCDPRVTGPEPLVGAWYYGILVDGDGRRFMDEARQGYDLQFDRVANEIFRKQIGTAYAIIDAGAQRTVPWATAMNDGAAEPVVAETIAELATQLGIDAAALTQTVEEFNAAVQGNTINPFTPLDGIGTRGLSPAKSNFAAPLTEGPYSAWPIAPRICFTYGGLRVDGSSRVLTPAGKPVPGLYAAGEIAGIFYNEYPSGSSGLRSMTFGRLAGKAVVSDAAVALTV